MGDSLKDYMMRGIFVICALAVIAGAFATTHEDSYSQATDLIQDMKKKGATEADCKDLAKTTCKEVLSEVKKDQTVIDSQSSGIECNKLGVRAVEVAVKHYHKRVRQWTISKKTITKWATHKINLGVKTFISLKPGKCGFIFASRSYRSIYAKYHRAVKYERTVRGWVIEAKKAVVITKRSQKNQQEKCRCAVAKRRDTIWRTINTKKKRVRKAKGERKSKEHAAKRAKVERAAKEKKNKAVAKERASKRRREQAAKAKAREQKAKHHERRSKAAERASKERSGKIERANKHKAALARRLAVRSHTWHGFINNWDHHMNWAVSGHHYVSGLQSWHHNGYEDRKFKPLVTAIGATQRHRHLTGWVNNMDGGFTYTCPTNQAIVGFYSYHNNGNEDRKWRFYCASFHGVGFRQGAWPGWQTSWDAYWNLNCGHNPAIGWSSYHDNRREDRRWRIRCGHRYATRM